MTGSRSTDAGQTSHRPLVVSDLYALRTASDAQPSPDGGRVAYVVTHLDRESDAACARLWLADVERGGGNAAGPARAVALCAEQDAREPRWSPDGGAIAFVSSDRQGSQIWLVRVDGAAAGGAGGEPGEPGQPVQLTAVPGGVSGPPVWSRDGRRIAFVSRVVPGEERVVPGEDADAAHRRAAAPRVIRRLRYMVNGAGYIGDGFWHVFVVDVAGAGAGAGAGGTGRSLQVTSGDWHHFSPAWSPDGTALAFISTRREDWDLEWVWDVFVASFEASGSGGSGGRSGGGLGEPRRVTASEGVAAAPAWSPDGRWIAYFDNRCPTTGSTKDYHLWVVAADGGAPRDLTAALDRPSPVSEPPGGNEPPWWSADSRIVHCQVREGGVYHLVACNLAGECRRIIAPTGAGDVGPAFVRASAAGDVLAFAGATATHPAEVYVCGPDGGGARRLTDLNDAWLAGVDLAAPERSTHRTTEGWEVESWTWLPPTYRSGDPPLPAILNFHGGPHNNVGPGFNHQMHMLTGAGFAVLVVNFRGSAGFGGAFADSILGDWGTRELEDGFTALDALVERGVADPQRVGIFGGSYGGFMTNLALTRSSRFRAAVSYATISALDTFSLQTDHWESIDWDSGGAPWERPDYYRSHSPLARVDHINTPLLILHGEADYRCSVGEADQLFAGLRKLGRPVELVRYPGASHAFSVLGRPSHRVDAQSRILAWFKRYL